MSKKVSIIMPSYNTEADYLRQSVASVINQDYKFLELIIVDDGSTEENWEIAKSCASTDSRIRLIRNAKNMGIVYSLNRALALATGDYVFRMDSDDVCEKDRIKVTVEYMDSHPEVDITGSQFRYLINGRKSLKKPVMPETNDGIKTRLLWATPFAHPTICFRTSSIKKYGIEYSSNEKAEDYNLWVSCAIKGCVFANIHNSLLRYRIHKNQITKVLSNKIKDSNTSIRGRLFEYLGIRLTEQETTIVNAFADGCATETQVLRAVDDVLTKLIPAIPASYAASDVVRQTLGKRFYHECLRAALSGNHDANRIYKEAKVSEYTGMKQGRILFLKAITLIR